VVFSRRVAFTGLGRPFLRLIAAIALAACSFAYPLSGYSSGGDDLGEEHDSVAPPS
jgi:hypothetical protein